MSDHAEYTQEVYDTIVILSSVAATLEGKAKDDIIAKGTEVFMHYKKKCKKDNMSIDSRVKEIYNKLSRT